MKKYLLLTLLFFIFLIFTGLQCPFQKTGDNNLNQGAVVPAVDVKLVTSDGFNIAATYFSASGDRGVILVHMYSQDRHDWDSFAAKLHKQNFNVLTIDLRGHGQSDGNLDEFSKSDFGKMVLDLEAAKNFLKEQNRDIKIKLVGASIGANIVLNYAVVDPEIESLILLSPGLEYHEQTTEDAIVEYKKSLLIVASQDDKYSYNSSRKLFDLAPESNYYKYFQTYKNAGHGTHMLNAVSNLDELLIKFLKDNLKIR